MATSSSCSESMEGRAKSAEGPICPICIDTFKTPRSLPCLHTFCESCILSLISTVTGETSKTNRFDCPLCRSATTAPVDIPNPSEWVKNFPLNHYVPTSFGNNEAAQTKLCDPCFSKDVRLIYDVFCLNCAEYLCKDCAQNHLMFKAFKAHKLITTNDIQKNPSRFFQELNNSFCVRHSDNKIEYFCKSHDVLCCTKCATLDHRKCEDVVDIMEVCTGIKENETKRLQSKLDEFFPKLDKIIELAGNRDITVKKQSGDIIQEVTSVTKKVEDMLAAYKSSVLEQLQQIGKTESLTMSEVDGTCQSLKAAIQGSVELLKTFMTHGTEQQMFILVRKLHDQIEGYERTVAEQLSKVKPTPDLGLEVSSASKLLEQNNLLEKLQQSNVNINASKEEEDKHAFSTKENFDVKLLCECGNVETVTFNPQYDSNCSQPNYTGATFVSGNRVVLVDNSGKRCYLFDSNFIPIADKKFPSNPFAVTSLDGHKIALSFPQETSVRILLVHDSFEHVKTIKMRWECWGIAAFSNGEIAVLCKISTESIYSKAVIAVIDTGGNEKNILDIIDISSLGYSTLGIINYDSKHIAVDKTRSRIICYMDIWNKTDQGNKHHLSAPDKNGIVGYKERSRNNLSALYKDKMVGFISASTGICIGVDQDGNVYYYDRYHSIVRISPSGRNLRDFNMQLSSHVTAMCFSHEHPNMFVFITANEPSIHVGRLC